MKRIVQVIIHHFEQVRQGAVRLKRAASIVAKPGGNDGSVASHSVSSVHTIAIVSSRPDFVEHLHYGIVDHKRYAHVKAHSA